MTYLQRIKAWQKFRNGDALSNEELTDLVKFAKEMEIGLQVLGETGGVLYKLRQDIAALESFQFHRQHPSV